jgi:acyl carrier protein
MTKEAVFEKVQEILEESFEINHQDITLESNLFTDLDLDSIDAVDMVVRLQEYTGRRIDPQVFKSVRLVSDVVDAVFDIIQENEPH